jgi:hypothetical protein
MFRGVVTCYQQVKQVRICTCSVRAWLVPAHVIARGQFLLLSIVDLLLGHGKTRILRRVYIFGTLDLSDWRLNPKHRKS